MRKIGIQEIEDIALGAALLGAGGGGDPYIGKLTAIGAVKECGEVELISADEVPDGAFIMPAASMGAPTILAEKGVGASEFAKLFDMVSRYFGKPVYATMPMEAGGVNSMLPIAAAARLGIPMVDADGMGRAFPELQMVTFTIGGASATPMAFIDEKGNSGILDTITNKWTEDIARAATMTMGGTLTIALFCMDADTCKKYGVHGIVTRSEELGRAIRTAKEGAAAAGLAPEEYFLQFTGGHKLFKGKIVDVLRETRGGVQLRPCGARGHRRGSRQPSQRGVPEREPSLHGGRRDRGDGARPHLPGGPRHVHARAHRRAQVRQARAGGGPRVLRYVAHAGGHRARGPALLRHRYRLHPRGRALGAEGSVNVQAGH